MTAALPIDGADRCLRLLERAQRLLQPIERCFPDQWAERNRTHRISSGVPGPRDPHLTPYIIMPGRMVATCAAKRVVLVTASQSGKTELMLDIAGQRLDQKPAPILYVGPNKQFLTEQFEPRVMELFEGAASLALKVTHGRRMTKTRKMVAGVPFRLAHAGSPSALKSDPAALALVDEYDAMVPNVKKEGGPLGLIEARGSTYPDFVAIVTSTPKRGMVQTVLDDKSGLLLWDPAPIEDVFESPIWQLWQQGSRHHWTWPCPHCRDYFVPRFDRLRWPENATPLQAARAVHLECPRCGGVIEERHKRAMNAFGRFVAPGQMISAEGLVSGEPPQTSTLSFWVSGLASPFVTFGDRLLTYLDALARGDDAEVQNAFNAGFGELFIPGRRDVKEWQQVARRKLMYHFGDVPDEVMKLTAGVDVQKTALVWSVRGWGERATSWQIESGELAGYTNEPEVWALLADVLLATYAGLHLSVALVDSGFRPDKPEEGWANSVYDFCYRFRRFCRATKGYDRLTAPILRGQGKVTIPGRGLQPSIEIVRLDTDFWKCRLQERLSWPVDQPGGFWLSTDATEDYCKQLVSEVRTITPSGRPLWVALSRRNHFFDVEVMNEAAGHLIAAQKIPSGHRREAQRDMSKPRPSIANMLAK